MAATEDLFTPIHKALRSMIYSLSSRLQTNDFADTAATKALVNDLENDFAIARSAGCALCILAHHAVDEETKIFADVAKSNAPLVTSLIADHHDLTRRELAIASASHELLAMESPEERIAAGIRINQAANGLFAAYFTHMNREEDELVPFMKDHFSDGQMAAMQGAIIGGMPPERMFGILAWMLPSLNVTELSKLLSTVGKGSPPAVRKAISDLCDAKVDPDRWNEVKLRVGF
jgi:hypothetical protein